MTSLKYNFSVFVSRILVQHFPFFNLAFNDVVDWHIRHKYYKEMSMKSEVVSSQLIAWLLQYVICVTSSPGQRKRQNKRCPSTEQMEHNKQRKNQILQQLKKGKINHLYQSKSGDAVSLAAPRYHGITGQTGRVLVVERRADGGQGSCGCYTSLAQVRTSSSGT